MLDIKEKYYDIMNNIIIDGNDKDDKVEKGNEKTVLPFNHIR